MGKFCAFGSQRVNVYSSRRIESGSPYFRDHHGNFVLFDAEGPGRLDDLKIVGADEVVVLLDGTEHQFLASALPQSAQWAKTITLRSAMQTALTSCIFQPFPVDVALESGIGDVRRPDACQTSISKLETDLIDPCDAESRSSHALTAQNESEVFEFDGRRHRSHLNRMAFEVSIDPRNLGVLIRRIYDRFHGRQRARVLVDDVAIGYWYAPIEDRAIRWGEDEFFIPAPSTSGKSKLRIQVDPSAGTPLWDVSEYRIYSVLEAIAEGVSATDSSQ